jgi:hypothetical protein
MLAGSLGRTLGCRCDLHLAIDYPEQFCSTAKGWQLGCDALAGYVAHALRNPTVPGYGQDQCNMPNIILFQCSDLLVASSARFA